MFPSITISAPLGSTVSAVNKVNTCEFSFMAMTDNPVLAPISDSAKDFPSMDFGIGIMNFMFP